MFVLPNSIRPDDPFRWINRGTLKGFGRHTEHICQWWGWTAISESEQHKNANGTSLEPSGLELLEIGYRSCKRKLAAVLAKYVGKYVWEALDIYYMPSSESMSCVSATVYVSKGTLWQVCLLQCQQCMPYSVVVVGRPHVLAGK